MNSLFIVRTPIDPLEWPGMWMIFASSPYWVRSCSTSISMSGVNFSKVPRIRKKSIIFLSVRVMMFLL